MIGRNIISAWKWIVSGLAGAGTPASAVTKWLRSIAAGLSVAWIMGAVKTATATAALAAGLSAYSFNFGDKASGLHQYARTASEFLNQGTKADAIGYVDKLGDDLDRYISDLTEEAESVNLREDESAAAKEAIQESIGRWQLQRQVVSLLKLDVQHRAGEITPEQWVEAAGVGLREVPRQSGDIAEHLLDCISIGTKGAWGLIKTDLPPPARGELAMWLAVNDAPQAAAPDAQVAEFYEELLILANDTAEAPRILTQYVAALDNSTRNRDRRTRAKKVNDVLDTFIALFPDRSLGQRPRSFDLARWTPALPGMVRLRPSLTAVPDLTSQRTSGRHTHGC